MENCEYLTVYGHNDNFSVISSNGDLADNQYKSIDPNGKRVIQFGGSTWKASIGSGLFLVSLLNWLSREGWEFVSSLNSGTFVHIYILLKRKIIE